MAEEVEGGVELFSLKSRLIPINEVWKQEIEQGQSQLEKLQAKLVYAKIQVSEENSNERFEELRQRVKDTTMLLTNFESIARTILVPDLANKEETGVVGKYINPLSNEPKDDNCTSSDSPHEMCEEISNRHGSNEHNGAFIHEILKSVRMITDLVEVLVKMFIMAETETAIEKEKVSLGQEEIRRKSLLIESMSARVEEMENFALGTNSLLNEMQQKVEDMVQESSRQRLRAAENEQELCRVKQDFEVLRAYVSSLISVREMLLSSEKHQTNEMHLERSLAMAAHLQGENVKKEAEVQKLMTENVRLSALLDKKEAQLVAMNEQCKVMALNSYGS